MSKTPSNEACIAAELTRAYRGKIRISPYRAACIAAELCALGRRYKRLSERLCGGEEEWGAWSDRVERAQVQALAKREAILGKACDAVAGWGRQASIEVHDLTFAVRTPGEETVCL